MAARTQNEPDEQKADDSTADAPKLDGLVEITLAHPLRKKFVDDFGLSKKDADAQGDLPVGTKLHVHPETARSIINAGHATVDVNDPDAIRAALTGKAPTGATS